MNSSILYLCQNDGLFDSSILSITMYSMIQSYVIDSFNVEWILDTMWVNPTLLFRMGINKVLYLILFPFKHLEQLKLI